MLSICVHRRSSAASFIPAIEDDKAGAGRLNQISQPVEESGRAYRGYGFFDPEDAALFRSLGSGEWNISGFQNQDLRRRLQDKTSGRISRLGKQFIALGLKLKELYIMAALSLAPAS